VDVQRQEPRRLAAPERPALRGGGLERVLARHGRLAPDDREHRVPRQRDAPFARRARDIGVKSAVERARGVLGPRQIPPQPEQLVGDPGQH
jgi:hypothetical protein